MSLNAENMGNKHLQNVMQLLAMLPEKELFVVENFIQFILSRIDDPIVKSFINASIDTEPLTEEEERNIHESLEAYSKGDVISFDDFAKEIPDGE